jgi:hypothetical protein
MNAMMKELDHPPPVTGTQKRKINRLVARAVAIEMLATAADAKLDVGLMPVDRIEQRWAVSIGAGLPSGAWDDAPASKPPPLDDDMAIVVDQINLHAPPRRRMLLQSWYKSPLPAGTIAQNLNVSRAGLYLEWRAALDYLRIQFLGSRHRGLIQLLNYQE